MNPKIDIIKEERPFETQIFRGDQILKAPRNAITAPTGGGTQDAEARTAINSIITTLEELGFIKPN